MSRLPINLPPTAPVRPARGRLRDVVFFGISFAAVPLQSIAFFTEPLQREFGWSHTQVSLGATVFSLSVIPFAPFAGFSAGSGNSAPKR